MNIPNNKLLNTGFLTLNVLLLLAFSNLTIFFSFYDYLQTINIPGEFTGIVIGIFAASAIIIRPFISTVLNINNAVKWLSVGLIATATALILYLYIHSFFLMILLRILHGSAYVVVVSSAITLLMAFMPPDKSGLGFGIISITTTIPYAIIPYIIGIFFSNTPLQLIYAASATLVLPALLLLFPLFKQLKQQNTHNPVHHHKLSAKNLWANIKQPEIICILIANALLFSVFALIMFFLKTFYKNDNIGTPELFFTLFTVTMIVARIIFGNLFDKYNKAILIIISLIIFSVSLVMLNNANSKILFYSAAIVYGLGMGSCSPLMNSLMFSFSRPEYRGLNTNLMLEMVDSGFFLGPAACGFAIASGITRSEILTTCSIIIIIAALLITPLIKHKTHSQ